MRATLESVLQGANDPRVLQVESDEIVAAAKANGYTAITAFLDRYLKGTPKAYVLQQSRPMAVSH